jgi:hypothetical protein
MNEPRCTGCGWALQAWIEEMSLFAKALDPLHMAGPTQIHYHLMSKQLGKRTQIHLPPSTSTPFGFSHGL